MKRQKAYLPLLAAAAAAAAPAWAGGDFTTLDWDAMSIDSVLPVYSEVVPLQTDHRFYNYTVALKYPEWEKLTPRETEVAERFAHLIADTITIHTNVSVSRKEGMLDINFYPIARKDGDYVKLLSCKMEITPELKEEANPLAALSAEIPAARERYAGQSALSEGKWVKISITTDGVYRLTRSALTSMGFAHPDNVRLYGYGGHRLAEVADPDNEYDDLPEAPLYKRDNDTWLFWGNGLMCWDGDTRVPNPYANEACYFLTEADTPASTPTEQSLADEPLNTYTTYTSHTLYEKDEFAWFAGGRNLYDGANYAGSRTHTYTLSTIASEGDEKLTVAFTAAGDTKTTLTPNVNGTDLATISISALGSYTSAETGEKTYDVAQYASGSEWTVRLTTSNDNDARLDYLALSYTRQLKTSSGFVAFSQTGSGTTRFSVSAAEGCVAMRIPSPAREGAIIQGMREGGTYHIVVDDPTQRYVVFEPQYDFPQPAVAGSVDNQNLHSLGETDMVIITPESGKLTAQAQRLAEAHEQYDGLRVAVARADRIYNEFSSGTRDATAYRRLMKMLYDRADTDEDAPKYLLLMGDCAWDNRMLSTAWENSDPKDYLLCFESENSLSDTKCYVMEDYFGLLDDGEGGNLTSDKVDIGVGRFPVVSEAEAKVMVDKSITFMSNANAGNWKNIVMMIGDDGDDNTHMKYSDDVAESIMENNPEMEVRKVMFDAYTRVTTTVNNSYPDVETLLKKSMEEGTLVMNYMGHAATYCLSHEFVLQINDFASTKSDNLPLWVTAACDVMPFDGQTANIGETAVLNDGGAAVAFYGTTRTVYSSNNLQMNRWFMRYLLDTDGQGRRYTVGDAVRLAKTYLISGNLELSNKENKLHYALLGDPALTFGAPTGRVRLDSINGQAPNGSLQLKAGQMVSMEGHVEDADGNTLPDFNGILSARVYDNLETITCKNNAGASSAFTFTNRDKVLFNGQDSIRSGHFTLSFVMPADINFSDEAGRVVFYAINADRSVEANGYSEDFIIGGVSDNSDANGPHIFAYLNTEDFRNGDRVNATPFFVARLEDESGISYSGNGLGHDLTLTIDNDPATTYTLNDYYSSVFGDYTQGSVAYSIPRMDNGLHSLTFRAWDVLNNTAAAALDFVVDGSLAPEIFNVTLTHNPAITTTDFIISHDRPGSECDITIEVFDFIGRAMWRHREKGVSGTGQYSVQWDLNTNSGGRLGAGVYLYKVTLSSDDSKQTTKSQKLIIAGNK